jgi:hypothetical protein
VADVIDRAAEAIKARLQELHDEERRLRQALTSLGPHSGDGRRKAPRRRRRKAAASKKAASSSRSTKRAARGQRREQFLAAVKETPGRTATELAEAIGVSPSQANTLARKAHADKLVTKRKKKYYPRS